MHNFKLGDRIVSKELHGGVFDEKIKEGLTGTVIYVAPNRIFTVEYDKDMNGHDGRVISHAHLGKDRHCWCYGDDGYERIEFIGKVASKKQKKYR